MSEPDPLTPQEDRPPVIQPFDVQAYATPGWDASPGPDQEIIVTAEAVDERRLLWPTFVTIVVAIGGALLVSGIVLAVAGAVSGGPAVFLGTEEFNKWLTAFVATDVGLAVLVLPGQLTFCAAALIAAAFSREKLADRLGLRQGSFAPWTWPLFLLGTPVVGLLTSQLLSRVVQEPSDQLQMLERLFEQHAAGSLAILLVLISLLPGFVEELLFRGFLQRRLLVRLPTAAAIGITTVFFAAAHMDPMHAVGVVPLGIWLGVIAWRADSIWPAVFGHIGNNAYAIVMTVLTGPEPSPEQVNPAVGGAVGLTLFAFAGCLVLLAVPRRHGGPAKLAKSPPRSGHDESMSNDIESPV
jgi:membrane protease YdiL (CAAX protease family)